MRASSFFVVPAGRRSVSYGQFSARGPPIDLDQDVTVDTLYPSEPIIFESSDKNGNSIILKLTYKNVSFFFMADASPKTQALLHNIQALVLKPGHHGARTSSSIEFLEQVHPMAL